MRPTIRRKLAAGFGIVLLLLLISSAVSLAASNRIAGITEQITTRTAPKQVVAADVRFGLADLYGFQTAYVLGDMEEQRKLFVASLASLRGDMAKLRPLLSRSDERREYERMTAAFATFMRLDDDAWEAIRRGDRTRAQQITLTEELPHYTAVLDAATKLRAMATAQQSENAAAAAATGASGRRAILVLGLVSLVVGALVAYFLSRTIANGLHRMLAGAEGIADGDLDQDVRVSSRDELGDMSRAFERMIASLRETAGAAERVAAGDLSVQVRPRSERDTLGIAFAGMTDSLRALVGDVSRTASVLTSASQQMATTSEEAGRAVEEIAGAVGEVAEGAQRQVEAVDSAKLMTEEVVAITGRSAGHAEQTAQAAAQAHRTAQSGVQTVTDATDAMQAVRAASQEAAEAIQLLGAKSEQIGGIVDTITGIAGQTNLLALNAAIEAARAGEQGRGFAVVAEEVRHLAEDSQRAAATIAGLIGEIRAETGNAVEVVQSGAQRTQEGVATVEQARESFMQIGTSVEDMGTRVTEIAAAIEQIADTAQKVNHEVGEVAAVTEQTSAASEEVSASTEETSASTQEIAASAQELSRTAAELDGLVRRFTLAA